MKSAYLLTCFTLLLASACDSIPADPGGTLDRVRCDHVFRLGLIATDQHIGAGREQAFLRRVAAETGAAPKVERGSLERLLTRLEADEIDLVVGEVAPDSPWAKRVSLLPPLGEQVSARGHVQLVPIARNGENAWIALLHRHAKAVAALP